MIDARRAMVAQILHLSRDSMAATLGKPLKDYYPGNSFCAAAEIMTRSPNSISGNKQVPGWGRFGIAVAFCTQTWIRGSRAVRTPRSAMQLLR